MGIRIGGQTTGKIIAGMSVFASLVVSTYLVQAETLTVAAVPSLKTAFREILPIFENEHGVTFQVMYGSSHALRQQIEKGAPIDVFLLEAVEARKLHQKGLTLNGGPRLYTQTSLVLVMSTASPAISVSFHEALPDRAVRIAVVDPKTSSVGDMTARAFSRHPALKTHPHMLHAPSSDDVVGLVSSGEADLGIVYRSDAISNGQVRIIDEAPVGRSIPVVFGQAVVSTCPETSQQAAEQFTNFMMSPRIQKLLLKYGFDALPTKERAE